MSAENNNLHHVLCTMSEPWAITRPMLEQINAIIEARIADVQPSNDFAALSISSSGDDDKEQEPYEIIDSVAILPVKGVIARRMNLFSRISGGISTELLTRDFLTALADPRVSAILLDVDSPGGSVGGLTTLADTIYNARGIKPIIAYGADQIASAAYWIGSAADKIIIEDTTQVGSIGVITLHSDYSRADEKAGVKRTYITAGKYKALGNDAEPLTEDARAEIQAKLDYIYTMFVDAVARNRGAETSAVLANMADGKIFIGMQAVEAGLADDIGTRDDAIVAALSMVEAQVPKYFIRRQ